jgi:hypothetical protein
MKKQIIILTALLSAAGITLGQGTINLYSAYDDTYTGGVTVDSAGNYYTGTYGLQVWALNSTTLPAGINLSPAPGSGVAAYNTMVADGFTLQASFTGQSMSEGFVNFGAVTLPTIPGPEAVLALVAWNTSATNWAAMLSSANASTRAGVIAFVNPVTPLFLNPGVPASLTGWTEDLVMTAIPEPSSLALLGLGVGTALAFRCQHRQRRRPPQARPP